MSRQKPGPHRRPVMCWDCEKERASVIVHRYGDPTLRAVCSACALSYLKGGGGNDAADPGTGANSR
jgi:hypothetical protein